MRMPLSEDDQRRLDEIEQSLDQGRPQFRGQGERAAGAAPSKRGGAQRASAMVKRCGSST